MDSQVSPISNLPSEILDRIGCFLDTKDIINISKTCKKLVNNFGASNNLLWFNVFQKCHSTTANPCIPPTEPFNGSFVYKKLVERNSTRVIAKCGFCGDHDLTKLHILEVEGGHEYGNVGVAIYRYSCTICLDEHYSGKLQLQCRLLFGVRIHSNITSIEHRPYREFGFSMEEHILSKHPEAVMTRTHSSDFVSTRDDYPARVVLSSDMQIFNRHCRENADMRRLCDPNHKDFDAFSFRTRYLNWFWLSGPQSRGSLVNYRHDIASSISTIFTSEYKSLHHLVRPDAVKSHCLRDAGLTAWIDNEVRMIELWLVVQTNEWRMTRGDRPIGPLISFDSEKKIVARAMEVLRQLFGLGDGTPFDIDSIERPEYVTKLIYDHANPPWFAQGPWKIEPSKSKPFTKGGQRLSKILSIFRF